MDRWDERGIWAYSLNTLKLMFPVSACPQDIIPINALNPLEVEFTVLA